MIELAKKLGCTERPGRSDPGGPSRAGAVRAGGGLRPLAGHVAGADHHGRLGPELQDRGRRPALSAAPGIVPARRGPRSASQLCLHAGGGRGRHSAGRAPCRSRGGRGDHGFRAATPDDRLSRRRRRTWRATSAILSPGCRRYRRSRRSPTIRRWSEGCSASCSDPVCSHPACSIVTGRALSVFARPIPGTAQRWSPVTTTSIPRTSCSMASACGSSTGRRPIATIPWSMWRRSRIFIAASPELEAVLLRSWLGREPDRAQRARLVLMRLLARLFYGCAASLNAAHALGTVAPETDLSAPTPGRVRRGRRAGAAGGRCTGGPAPRRQDSSCLFPGRCDDTGVRGGPCRRPAGLLHPDRRQVLEPVLGLDVRLDLG